MLGGLPITGGAKVRFSNIIIGTLMYAILNSGLSILGYEPQVQQLIKGVVFLIFVALTIDRKAGTGYEKLTASFPLVCSVTEDANTPRKPSEHGNRKTDGRKKACFPGAVSGRI